MAAIIFTFPERLKSPVTAVKILIAVVMRDSLPDVKITEYYFNGTSHTEKQTKL